MKFDKLSNKEVFKWVASHPSKRGLSEIERRWIDFWERAKQRIHDANEQFKCIENSMQELDNAITSVETRLLIVSQKQAKLGKTRTEKRLRLICNNLRSVTRQIQESEPVTYIPESQIEAFHEFLQKLKINP